MSIIMKSFWLNLIKKNIKKWLKYIKSFIIYEE